MKDRNGTATVCVEFVHKTKVGHWGIPEKAVHEMVMRESGDLLEQLRRICSRNRSYRLFFAGKRPWKGNPSAVFSLFSFPILSEKI